MSGTRSNAQKEEKEKNFPKDVSEKVAKKMIEVLLKSDHDLKAVTEVGDNLKKQIDVAIQKGGSYKHIDERVLGIVNNVSQIVIIDMVCENLEARISQLKDTMSKLLMPTVATELRPDLLSKTNQAVDDFLESIKLIPSLDLRGLSKKKYIQFAMDTYTAQMTKLGLEEKMIKQIFEDFVFPTWPILGAMETLPLYYQSIVGFSKEKELDEESSDDEEIDSASSLKSILKNRLNLSTTVSSSPSILFPPKPVVDKDKIIENNSATALTV